jgi:hypothetical protein
VSLCLSVCLPACLSVCLSVLLLQCVISTAKYFQQFKDYKQKSARGFTWDGKGNEISPAGEREMMDVEGGGAMQETSNPVATSADDDAYEMET